MQQPFGMNGAWQQQQQHGGPWQNQQQYRLPPTPQPQDGIPTVRIAGTHPSTPGGVSYEIISPMGAPFAKLEVYPLHMGMAPPSAPPGPVREGFARPSADETARRQRSASVMSGLDYDAPGPGASLADRISQPSRNGSHYGGSQAGSFHAPPGPQNSGFFNSRPNSRMSNVSGASHFSNGNPRFQNGGGGRGGFGGGPGPAPRNGNGFINYGDGANPRFRPYSQASNARPSSSNTYRSDFSHTRTNFTGQSTTSVRLVKDTYYPIYQGNEVVGTYDRLPADRQKPWFTPLPESFSAGLECRNLDGETTLEDISSTFDQFTKLGTIDSIELLEHYRGANGEALLACLLVFTAQDDADMAQQKMDSMEADGHTLSCKLVDPSTYPRPFANSVDRSKFMRPNAVASTSAPARRALGAESPFTNGAGGRTPLHLAASSPRRAITNSNGNGNAAGGGASPVVKQEFMGKARTPLPAHGMPDDDTDMSGASVGSRTPFHHRSGSRTPSLSSGARTPRQNGNGYGSDNGDAWGALGSSTNGSHHTHPAASTSASGWGASSSSAGQANGSGAGAGMNANAGAGDAWASVDPSSVQGAASTSASASASASGWGDSQTTAAQASSAPADDDIGWGPTFTLNGWGEAVSASAKVEPQAEAEERPKEEPIANDESAGAEETLDLEPELDDDVQLV